MAEKKFSFPQGCAPVPGAGADYDAAEVFDKLRVGKLGVYYREGFKLCCFPFSYMERAFIRIQEVNGRMCCGNAVFAYYRLVLVHAGKETADVISEKEEAMDRALARIGRNAPQVAIGFPADGKL